ncbi:hypothetical protein C8Q73DRAFT_714225 [Cubamyces lactineus]|nr:hypothetical protein C8Q73DRAFT_714225 [Cubamyces lactineus]
MLMSLHLTAKYIFFEVRSLTGLISLPPLSRRTHTRPIPCPFNMLGVLNSLAMLSGLAAAATWTPPDPEVQDPISHNTGGDLRPHRLIPCASGILGQNGLLDILPPNVSFSGRIECGLFDVPLDWADPEIGQTQVHYARYPADPDVEREGTIFVDPGIYSLGFINMPGEAVTRQQSWMLYGALNLHNLTHGKFDVVVWNPRGYSGHPDLTAPSLAKCFDTRWDKERFYGFYKLLLNLEIALYNQMELVRELRYSDATHWLQLQAAKIEECILKQNTTLLRYMGTAATVRDLVAMADFFDGPGSAVNFRGTESGARIGQYLLQMFPERAGRVVLQAPQDLEAYLYQDSYETWREDVIHSQNTISSYIDSCAKTENQRCSTLWYSRNERNLDEDNVAITLLTLFGVARRKYMGLQNSRELDRENTVLRSAFKPFELGNWTFSAADLLYEMQHVPHIEDLTLSMMPIYCGDKASDYDPEAAAERTREIAAMLQDDVHLAPLLSLSMFPTLDYLCHLWPFRAVERLTLDVDNPIPKVPAVAPLVVQYSSDPLARHHPLSKVAPGVRGARGVIQMGFGVYAIDSDSCMGDIFLEYLVHGKLPDRWGCFGDPQLDGVASPEKFTVMGLSVPAALQRVTIQLPCDNFHARSVAAAALVLPAVAVAVVTAVLKKRLSRSTVQPGEGEAQAREMAVNGSLVDVKA